MEKVKVTSEQAERIEDLKENKSFRTFITCASTTWRNSDNKCLNDLTIEQQATAWINGYEVELTPHEKILEYYKGDNASEKYMLGKRTGISVTLSILGITIEGVNDNG